MNRLLADVWFKFKNDGSEVWTAKRSLDQNWKTNLLETKSSHSPWDLVTGRVSMNFYSELLRKAFDEVGAFAASKKGAEWPRKWYVEIQRLLALAADEQADKKAEQHLDTIIFSVSKSGPLDPRFSPSLSAARVAMQARHKRPAKTAEKS